MVYVSVGKNVYTVLLDTGASRNLIRASFLKELQSDPATKDSCLGPFKGDRRVGILGIHKDQPTDNSQNVETIAEVRLKFMSGTRNRMKPEGQSAIVNFGVMESCADPMVIGCPQMFAWGYLLRNNPHGEPMVKILDLKCWPTIDRWFPNEQLEDVQMQRRTNDYLLAPASTRDEPVASEITGRAKARTLVRQHAQL